MSLNNLIWIKVVLFKYIYLMFYEGPLNLINAVYRVEEGMVRIGRERVAWQVSYFPCGVARESFHPLCSAPLLF